MILRALPIEQEHTKYVKNWNHEQKNLLLNRMVSFFAGKNLWFKDGKVDVAFSGYELGKTLQLHFSDFEGQQCFGLNSELQQEEGSEWVYRAFLIGNDGKFYAVLWDSEENEKTVQI